MLTKPLLSTLHDIAWPGLQLRISVDGLPKTHDQMRGKDGSWETVDRSVKEVADLRSKYGFRFGINFAVTDASMGEMQQMVAYAQKHGADLIPGINVDPFLVGTIPPEKKKPKVIMISDPHKAMKVLADARMGTKKQLPLIDHLYSRWQTKRTFHKQLFSGAQRFHCRELRDLIYILPNGDIVRCGLDHKAIGNLREQSFDEIWFGSAIESFRKKVAECPGCLQASVQILSRLYGGCLFEG